jgi:hypothetical protein
MKVVFLTDIAGMFNDVQRSLQGQNEVVTKMASIAFSFERRFKTM